MNRLALVTALAVAGCSESPDCRVPPLEPQALTDSWPKTMAFARQCTRHWSRYYARAREPAADTADAAIGQCYGLFTHLAQLSAKPSSGIERSSSDEWAALYRREALAEILRARLDGC